MFALMLLALAADPTDVFSAGQGGYINYRIPGIISTPSGTLLAYCEARQEATDWGRIDILGRRSTDGGVTWGEPSKLAEAPADASKNAVAKKYADKGVTLNNPVMIADQKPGVVHFLYCVEYARCFYRQSTDDGRTFGPPVEITTTFDRFRPEYDWKVLATGPGHGVQLKSGRLLVPVWLSLGTGGGAHRPSCVSTIVSDDGGATWQRGAIICNDPNPINPNETAAVPLRDGGVMLNIRHEGINRLRAMSVSPNGIDSWSPLRFDPALPDPVCFGSLCRLDGEHILFTNCHSSVGRRNLTIKLSRDEGRTWPVSRVIEAGTAGYSDIAVTPSGQIVCFYERGPAGDSFKKVSLVLARVTMDN